MTPVWAVELQASDSNWYPVDVFLTEKQAQNLHRILAGSRIVPYGRLEATPAPLAEREPSADEREGIDWWNSLTESERAAWLAKAQSARPSDAWAACKRAKSCSDAPEAINRLAQDLQEFVDGESNRLSDRLIEYEVEEHPWASEEGPLHPHLAERMTHEQAAQLHAATSPFAVGGGAIGPNTWGIVCERDGEPVFLVRGRYEQ